MIIGRENVLGEQVWSNKYKMEDEVCFEDTLQRNLKEFKRKDIEILPLSIDDQKMEVLSEIGKKIFMERCYHYDTLYDNMFYKSRFCPGGSVLYGIGRQKPVSLSNCFVKGNTIDSIGGIMSMARDSAEIYKRRGGVGTDISHLRPKEAMVNNAAETSSGAVSFLNILSPVTSVIGQNGRRGALMVTMDIRHPDSIDFIQIKQDETKINGANLSVKINDDFMRSVITDTDYILRFPCDMIIDGDVNVNDLEYNKLTKCNNGYVRKIRAKELWNLIVKCAHNKAEPGIIFWDK